MTKNVVSLFDSTAELTSNLSWKSDDERLAKALNTISLMTEYSPGHGDKAIFIVQECAAAIPGLKIVSMREPAPIDPDVVY